MDEKEQDELILKHWDLLSEEIKTNLRLLGFYPKP